MTGFFCCSHNMQMKFFFWKKNGMNIQNYSLFKYVRISAEKNRTEIDKINWEKQKILRKKNCNRNKSNRIKKKKTSHLIEMIVLNYDYYIYLTKTTTTTTTITTTTTKLIKPQTFYACLFSIYLYICNVY